MYMSAGALRSQRHWIMGSWSVCEPPAVELGTELWSPERAAGL